VETLGGRKPVAIGVSHASAIQAVALARHASSIGATAVLATAPYFGQPPLAEIRNHFATIADVGLPLFVYNTPSRVGYGLSPSDVAEIAQVPGVVGIKQAAPDILELVELLETMDGSGCLVLGGSENTIWPALAVGAVGNTATAASAIPQVFARFWVMANEGRLNEGRDLYRRLTPLRKALFSRLPIGLVHHLSLYPTLLRWLALRLGLDGIEYFRLLRRLSLRHLRSIVFDQMLPKIAHYWSRETVDRMMRDAGLDDVKLTWVNEMSWCAIGAKPGYNVR